MQNLDKYTFPTKNGQLLSTEPHPNGNMLRSTAELLLLAGDRLTLEAATAYKKGIRECIVLGSFCLFSRYFDSIENTSVDDYLAIGTRPILAAGILYEARAHWGFLDVNRKFNVKQFLPRFVGMWQNLRIVAGENVGIIGSLIWAFSLYLAARQPITNQDSWSLSHLMVITYERSAHKSFFCELAIEYWRQMKTRNTSDIMADYTGIPDHPLVEAWKPYK